MKGGVPPLRTFLLVSFVGGLVDKALHQPLPDGSLALVSGMAAASGLAVHGWRRTGCWPSRPTVALVFACCALACLCGSNLGGVGCQDGCSWHRSGAGTHTGRPAGLVSRVRERSREALDPGLPNDVGALLAGMTLGDASGLSRQAKSDFRRSSLTHIVAASGQNVALLLTFSGLLLGWAGIPRRLRLVVGVLLIAAYVPLAGAQAPIRRAAIMGICSIACTGKRGARSVVHALLVAAAVTILADPDSVHSLGWQLSFAAFGGITLLSGPIAERLKLQGMHPAVADALAVTVAATTCTSPLIASAVGRLSVTAIPANLLVAGVIGPVMVLGFSAAFLGQFSHLLGAPFAVAAALPVAFILEVAHLFASPRWAVVAWRPTAGAALAWTVVIAGLLMGLRPRRVES